MPYDGEFAHHQSLRRLVQSDKVKQLLGSYHVREQATSAELLETLTSVSVERTGWLPERIVAIDGSYLPVTIQNGFPGAEAAYVTIASVLINVAKIRELDKYRPVNPVEFRKTQEAESIDCALPGCNVISIGEESAASSFRKAVYEVFKDKRVFDDGETLLDTYEALLKFKPASAKEQLCPYLEDCFDPTNKYKKGQGQYLCSCLGARVLYSTDGLGIHEGMNPAGTNGSMFGEIMQVWERVWIIHFLRALEARGWLSSLRRIAIVLDGPLAIFGEPAWMSHCDTKVAHTIVWLCHKQ